MRVDQCMMVCFGYFAGLSWGICVRLAAAVKGRSGNVFTLVLRGMDGVEYFSRGISKSSSYTCKGKAEWKSAFIEINPLCLLSISIKTDQRKLR